MPLNELKNNKVVTGIKQCYKAIINDNCKKLFVAKDSEKFVIKSLVDLAEQKNIEIVYVDSMHELGKASGIEVKSATSVILKK